MLVGAFACPHTPQLLARPGTEDRDLVLRVHAAFARVKQRLEGLRPEGIAIVAGDHVEAFFLNAVPALAVYAGTECAGTFGRYHYRFPIHEPLARTIVEQGIERGFDLFYTQEAPLDYAFYVPLHFTMPEPAVPIVPLHVNVYLPPQPTPRRCYDWGKALGEILRARPERVVLMASGGMSHFPGTDRYASPEFDYDRGALGGLGAGRRRPAGGGHRGGVGQDGQHRAPHVGHAPRRGRRREGGRLLLRALVASWQRGRRVAGMTDELHYRFPPAAAYRLNRCLFALKSDDGFRTRFLKDAAVALRAHALADEGAA